MWPFPGRPPTCINRCLLNQLRQYLTPTILDQLPPLSSLLRYLEELSLFEPPATSTKPLVGFVEEIPKIIEGILQEADINNIVKDVIIMLEKADEEDDVLKG